MSGRFTQRGCEAGAQTPPLLRASSLLKPKINRGLTLRLVQRTGALQLEELIPDTRILDLDQDTAPGIRRYKARTEKIRETDSDE
jgi:hypothetical protein